MAEYGAENENIRPMCAMDSFDLSRDLSLKFSHDKSPNIVSKLSAPLVICFRSM